MRRCQVCGAHARACGWGGMDERAGGCTHPSAHTGQHSHTYTHTYTHAHTPTHHTHTHACTRNTHVRAHTRTQSHTHTHTHTHIHTHTRTHATPLPAAGGTADPDGIDDAFELVAEINERVKTAVWVGDCFIYNTAAWRLNYCVGGEVGGA